jgi:hypothetical protein
MWTLGKKRVPNGKPLGNFSAFSGAAGQHSTILRQENGGNLKKIHRLAQKIY